MRRSSSLVRILSALLLPFAMMTASAADAVDASGTWQLTVLDTGRTFTPSFTLKQNGEQLTGTYKNSMGDNPASGTIKGKEVTLNAEIKGQGGPQSRLLRSGNKDKVLKQLPSSRLSAAGSAA